MNKKFRAWVGVWCSFAERKNQRNKNRVCVCCVWCFARFAAIAHSHIARTDTLERMNMDLICIIFGILFVCHRFLSAVSTVYFSLSPFLVGFDANVCTLIIITILTMIIKKHRRTLLFGKCVKFVAHACKTERLGKENSQIFLSSSSAYRRRFKCVWLYFLRLVLYLILSVIPCRVHNLPPHFWLSPHLKEK